jgi:hypothetical protein
MLEILKFIFSGFRVWFGSVILLAVLGHAVALVILAVRGRG